MSEFIDRQVAIDYIMLQKWRRFEGMTIEDAIITMISEVPSAEPEIIRCKDCKYHVIHTLFGRSQAWCERLCDEFDKSMARGVEPDDYCSRAERRTDG